MITDTYDWDAEVCGYRIGVFAEGALVVHILPMIFNHRVMVSRLLPDGRVDQMAGVVDAWCYDNLADALAACGRWNPDLEREPGGWKKHPFSERRNGEPYPASS